MVVMFKYSCISFICYNADDTIVLAISEQELKAALWAVQQYCEKWMLEGNVKNTKL